MNPSPELRVLGIALSTAFGRGLSAAGHSFSVTFAHRDIMRETPRLIDGGFVVDMRPIAYSSAFVSLIGRSPILSLSLRPCEYAPFSSGADILSGRPSSAPTPDALSRVLSFAYLPSHVALDEFGVHGYVLYWYLRGARVAYRAGSNLLFHRSAPSFEERLAYAPSIPWTPNESILEPIPLAAASLSSPFHAW